MIDADSLEIRDLFAYKAGVKAENERIIRLLEEHTLMVDEGTCWCLCGEPETWYGLDYQDHQIALIKGEK